MRQLNARFLLGLIGVMVLLTGGVFLIHYAQAGRIARALQRQAERAEQQGRLDQKVKYLARYLEFVPQDNETRAELGRTLTNPEVAVSIRSRERALFVLGQVLLSEPDRHDSRRLLARMAVQLGRSDLAREHLDFLKQHLPEDGEVLRLLGQWHEARNNETDLNHAADHYLKAIEKAPQDVEGHVRLAYLLRRRPELRTADNGRPDPNAVMDNLVARNGEAFQAYLARWQYRQQFHPLKDTKDIDQAAQDVDLALKLAPDEAGVRMAAAELAQLRGQLPEARSHLEAGLQAHPRDASLYQALARLEVQADKRARAIDCLRQGLQKVKPGQGQSDLLWTLANLLIDDGNLVEAEEAIGQLRRARALPAGVDYVSARLLIKQGQWAEASRVLERARPHLEGLPELGRQADLLLGQCYERLDEPAGRRLPIYQRMVQRDPNSAAARQAMAASLCAMGRFDDALEQYQQLMTLPDAPAGGWTQIARLLLMRNLRRGQGDWKDVEEALKRAEQAQPGAVEVVLLRSELLLAQNRPDDNRKLDEARKLLEEARDRQPKQVEYWAALAALAERQGDPKEARRLLEEAGKHAGDTVELRLSWARYWSARRGDKDARVHLAKLAESLESFDTEGQTRLLFGLVEALSRLRDFKEAEQLWGRLATQPRYRSDLRVQQLWFDLALQAGDEDTLQRVLGTIRGIEQGEGPLGHYGEALRLIRLARQGKKEGLDQARSHLDAAGSRRPSWPAVFLARAAVDDLKGSTEQAIANYRRAMELGERSPQVTRELVQLLHRRQRFAEAEEEIRLLEKQTTGLSPEMKRLAADVSLHNNDLARAVRLGGELTRESTDYRDYLWLGQVLAARGQDPDKAEQNLSLAVELGAEIPETWVALVGYLAASKQAEKAEKAVAEAQAKLPAKLAPLALAQCYETLGQGERADEQYVAALKAQPGDVVVLRTAASFYLRVGSVKRAEPLLRPIIERKVEASESDVAWARRTLALALANHSDYQRFPEALGLLGLRLEDETRLVEEKKPAEGELAEDQRARARVLVTSNRRPLRRHAIGFLEGLSRQQALTLDDQFLLAQLYEADGAWPKAREQFRSLTAAGSASPLALAHAARAFLRQRELDEARRCIERLEEAEKARQTDPGLFGSVELRTQLLEANNRGEEAVRLLKAHAERAGAPPEGALLLAGCLARQNRLTEALGVCEQVWPRCPPEAVGGASVAALRSGKPDADHRTRVERLLLEAIKQHPQNNALLLHLADLRDLQESYEAAEKLYRQVLARDEANVVALNNLAWMLAQNPAGAAEALALVNRAIELVGPRAELLDTRAAAHLAQRRSDLAIADLDRSTAEAPSGQRLFHLARAHQLANNRQAASDALLKAKKEYGLIAEQLHPVERVAYRKMLDELKE